MAKLTSGLAAGMVLKSAGPYSKKGLTVAPYRNLSGVKAGVTEANANLAEAAAEARDRGMTNIGGLPGAAGYVKLKLSGKQVNPSYWDQKKRAADERHANVGQVVQSLRQRAASLRSNGRGL
jgi:hypothetical protein